jgi:hypothetical protein
MMAKVVPKSKDCQSQDNMNDEMALLQLAI